MVLQERGPTAGSDAAPDLAPATYDTTPGPAWTGPAPAGWRRARAVIAWADRPAVPGLIALLAAAGFVLARWDLWARRSISRFILIGRIFAHPAQLPAGMPLRAQYGYDGQFYYRLAINPLNFSHTAYGITVDSNRNAGAPFIATYEAIRNNLGSIDWSGYNAVDIWLAELAALLVFAVAALCSLRASRTPAHERLALLLFLIEICVVTPSTWNSRSADLRSFVEVYLMAVIVLLGRPRQPLRRPGAWLLPAATAGLLPVLDDIVRLRLHWS